MFIDSAHIGGSTLKNIHYSDVDGRIAVHYADGPSGPIFLSALMVLSETHQQQLRALVRWVEMEAS